MQLKDMEKGREDEPNEAGGSQIIWHDIHIWYVKCKAKARMKSQSTSYPREEEGSAGSNQLGKC